MPHRYVDAVQARRRELREQCALLTPGRNELRDALALARASTAAEAVADLTDLRHEIDAHTAPVPHVVAAARAIEDAARARWAERAAAAVVRTAADRGVAVLPAPEPPIPPRLDPPPPHPARTVDMLADPGAWRLAALPLAVVPLSGFAGPAALFPAFGAGVLVLGAVLRSRRAATDRARHRTWCSEILTTTRARIDGELGRRALATLAEAAPLLDGAIARRHAELDAERSLLTSQVSDV